MNKEERSEKIKKLKLEQKPLKSKILMHELRLTNFQNLTNEDQKKLKSELEKFKNDLLPIEKELNELRCLYEIEFDGLLRNIDSGKNYSNSYKELYYLNECVLINTTENGWDEYIELDETDNLLSEIGYLIYTSRFTRFTIKNIKRIK